MYFLDKWLVDRCGHANTDERARKAAESGLPDGLMILGTDTDVGKTQVATLLIRQLVERGYRVGAYKPAASGVESADDNELNIDASSDPFKLRQATGLNCSLELVCPQVFRAAIAPPIAARREGKQVDQTLLVQAARRWREHCDLLVAEGAGGALSPLGSNTTVLDVAVALGYPVVLVAAHRLGMMNHTLLTLEALRHRGLELLALVVNQNEPLSVEEGREAKVRLDETMACLLPFCGKIACYGLEYEGSTLFPLA